MYVLIFGMACIEGAGLSMASLCVVLHCLSERDMHLVVWNWSVRIHRRDTSDKETGGMDEGYVL